MGDKIYVDSAGLAERKKAIEEQLASQQDFLDKIQKGVDTLSGEWKAGAQAEYVKNMAQKKKETAGYIDKIRGFLSLIVLYERAYTAVDSKEPGSGAAKIMTLSPAYLRTVAGRLEKAGQHLENAYRDLAKANDSSSWTAPEIYAVRALIQGSVTKLKNVASEASDRANWLKKRADELEAVSVNYESSKNAVTRTLGVDSGVKMVKWGSVAMAATKYLVLPSIAHNVKVVNDINTILSSLRSGITNMFRR